MFDRLFGVCTICQRCSHLPRLFRPSGQRQRIQSGPNRSTRIWARLGVGTGLRATRASSSLLAHDTRAATTRGEARDHSLKYIWSQPPLWCLFFLHVPFLRRRHLRPLPSLRTNLCAPHRDSCHPLRHGCEYPLLLRVHENHDPRRRGPRRHRPRHRRTRFATPRQPMAELEVEQALASARQCHAVPSFRLSSVPPWPSLLYFAYGLRCGGVCALLVT
jgi:hypothetical protein